MVVAPASMATASLAVVGGTTSTMPAAATKGVATTRVAASGAAEGVAHNIVMEEAARLKTLKVGKD